MKGEEIFTQKQRNIILCGIGASCILLCFLEDLPKIFEVIYYLVVFILLAYAVAEFMAWLFVRELKKELLKNKRVKLVQTLKEVEKVKRG